MPVPITSDASTKPPASAQPSQKSMTKAERRELQERQRAAKLLQKQPAGSTTTAGGAAPQPSKSKPPSTPSQKKISGEASGSSGGGTKTSLQRDVNIGSAGLEDGAGLSRGLRIFTHFGLPKPVGHTVKGDIHPAIIRLGLLFSEFRICGANARCIATLTAFKNVCPFAFCSAISDTVSGRILNR
jgi:translation initiation factor eIF-2B subunit delta